MIPPDAVIHGLRTVRQAARAARAGGSPIEAARFPRRAVLEAAIADLAAALYPRRIGGFAGEADAEDRFVADVLARALAAIGDEVDHELHYWAAEARAPFDEDQARTIVRLFAATLPDIRRLIDSDIDAAFLGDPAARSVDEILVCYPGAIAALHHRIAHQLHQLGAVVTARIVSEIANERTGIDIHPGATIGPAFFIDHGTGVVIGETAIVGARVRLYQHVTLGARSPLGSAHPSVVERHARHPIVGDDVVVYAGATILGRVNIGHGATIGGNVWLLSDVPAGAVIVQPEARALPADAASDLRETLTHAGA
ncbi:serine acetyltransferase [Sphingomonas sp. Leaf412]|uniref:serine O-acetyltransferase EpsC n=1 Tax=Sphingomonas sp. Leaf412 TaxID=1736370 RepID=UPI0006FE12AF|nr:serine O-acetyltransferase EpsC [Sphingomonas sp. Leaf412]KQT34624.1 serine acetyltransferase [Sphingomonas sp. Leaf412]